MATRTCDNFFKSYTPCIAAAPDGSCIVAGHQNGYLHKLTSIDSGDYDNYDDIDRLHQSTVNTVAFFRDGLLVSSAGIRIAVRPFA
jgi:hypothetical protein